ncbi:methyl-accepting chemotaxis protein [Clostridium grantii]|uniref:Methyl-accepting chemotaxis protein n=1 Tax=Clostridium grantii DSM 8605 TaxID=1121316 RepID=A0A1M5W6F2_9CLOT|nr:methyl-accepting chemotaxis protein [Clostridium grantii]SHH83050.1 methyl-accepting chemotaxis protein [Clostridium grantii DSM 8605]
MNFFINKHQIKRFINFKGFSSFKTVKNFKNLKISTKLLIAFVLVSIITCGVGAVGIINMKEIDKNNIDLYNKTTIPMQQAAIMSKLFQRINVSTRDLVFENTDSYIKGKYSEILKIQELMDKEALIFEQSIETSGDQELYNKYLDSKVAFLAVLEELYALCLQNDDVRAYDLLRGRMSNVSLTEQTAIENLLINKVAESKMKVTLNTSITNKSVFTMIFLIFIGMAIAIILGIYISKIISKPIKNLLDSANLIAEGNLAISLDINSKDEIGNLATSFTNMTFNMNNALYNISSSSQKLALVSNEMAVSSISLSEGATQQASAIEELAATIEFVSSQTHENALNAQKAKDISIQAKNYAFESNQHMSELLESMNNIQNFSQTISKIIKVIDNLAFQTNILAINASIESARVGKQGKGFSVIADEIRSLSVHSANASKETSTILNNSIALIQKGTIIADLTAQSLNNIVEKSTNASNIVENIAFACDEQSVSLHEVKASISQISMVVHCTSSTSDQTATTSKILSNEAGMLKSQINNFKLKNTFEV